MKYLCEGTDLTSVADAIRTKGGTSADLSFPDDFISAISAIPTGEPPTLVTKAITANGTYDASDDSADGYSSVTVNVPSVHISGTFTPTTAGQTMTVTVPYTGSGYPIAIVVCPSEGSYNTSGSFYTAVEYRAVIVYIAIKNELGTTPDYTGSSSTANRAMTVVTFKSSSSTATSTSVTHSKDNAIYSSASSAQAYSGDMLKIHSATELSVITSNSAYGFAPNVEYTYHVIYSS